MFHGILFHLFICIDACLHRVVMKYVFLKVGWGQDVERHYSNTPS